MRRICCVILGLSIVAQAADYVIITDSTTSPENALSTFLFASEKESFLRKKGISPKIQKKVSVDQSQKSKHFGLIEDFDGNDADSLLKVPGVLMVVPNVDIFAAEYTSQWNLDRIDQAFGQDGVYEPSVETGNGVDLYIVDSGVKKTHESFGDRVQRGLSAISPELGGDNDCNGHGTHVASTAAGDKLGVARGANIIPVQILDCAGRGSLYSLATGVSFVVSELAKSTRRAVVNLSIQAAANDGIDILMRDMFDAGAVVVVAAANFNSNACNYSPAREPKVVTVGASSQDDSKLPSSNYGPCVTLFAPGDDIIGAGLNTPTELVQKQGTSMASPLVAGVVATLREKFPKYSNQEIIKVLMSLSTLVSERTVMDADCAGSIAGMRLLQSIPSPVQKLANSFAAGSKLKSDFLNWSPALTLTPTDGSLCMTFSAQVLAARSYPATSGSLKVMVSTDVLPTGITSYLETSLNCRTFDSRWYIFENGPRLAQAFDFQRNMVGTNLHESGAELSASNPTEFYFELKTTAEGVSVEFGRGNGESERTRDALISALDVNSKMPIEKFKYLSFSTPVQFDVLFSNLRTCKPIQNPDNNGGGGEIAPAQLAVGPTAVNSFFIWPSGWTKSPLSLSSCMMFTMDAFVKGAIMVGIANQPLGLVSSGAFTNQPMDAQLYEFRVTPKNSVLYRNGKIVNAGTNRIKFWKKSGALKLRASVESNIIRIEAWRRQKWVLVYQFADTLPEGLGKRFSLGSSLPRSFTGVEMC